MLYFVLDTALIRNLLRVLSVAYEDRDDGLLYLNLTGDQWGLLRMWRVDLIGPISASDLNR